MGLKKEEILIEIGSWQIFFQLHLGLAQSHFDQQEKSHKLITLRDFYFVEMTN